MRSETTAARGAEWTALHDVKYDVRSLFAQIHSFQPTDRELKAILKAKNCPSDLRCRQTWQELHALLLVQQQAVRRERAAARERWEARAKPWAQWLVGFQQALQSQAAVRERQGQDARQQQSQQYSRRRVRPCSRAPQFPLRSWQVLGLDPGTATIVEIKQAYRRLALQYHPDRGGCANRFQEIHQAYELLMARAAAS